MSERSKSPKPIGSKAIPTAEHRIETVLFDYGQVLSKGPNTAAWDRLREALGTDPETFHTAYWASRHDYDRGTLTGTAYWRGVAAAVHHPGLDETELANLYSTDVELWSDLNDPMLAWARDLQKRGVRTGILSNIGDRMEIGIRERFEWIESFHHCTWSHQLKLAKPEVAIYHHAALALKTEPRKMLFIDDRVENVEGARVAGMNALQYFTHDLFVAEMQERGWGYLL